MPELTNLLSMNSFKLLTPTLSLAVTLITWLGEATFIFAIGLDIVTDVAVVSATFKIIAVVLAEAEFVSAELPMLLKAYD